LKRTLGVPVFQEQLLRIAMVSAGFTGGEAEELRRALGFKRSKARMNKIGVKLQEGLKHNGITRKAAETIIHYITSFALYGFPESHSASFALLAYASAYIKAHYPAAFYTALLNNQPMGFYHPATLIKDAQRHCQKIQPINVLKSNWLCTIEEDGTVRLGLMYVSGLRKNTGKTIERERGRCLFTSIDDLQQRTGLKKSEMTTLAQIGALHDFGLKRRQALWQVEETYRSVGSLFASLDSTHKTNYPLREMSAPERLIADYYGMGITLGPHPLELIRPQLEHRGVAPACRLTSMRHGSKVCVAGGIIVRQRPQTARGVFFMSLEDETGITNIIIGPDLFQKNRLLLLNEPFLLVKGRVQNQNNVVSVRARKFQSIQGMDINLSSHNFC